MAHERIEINPEIMGGKPVIRGTRVPVEIVLRKLGAGMTPEAIMADHPRLTPEDLRAAQAFAADLGRGRPNAGNIDHHHRAPIWFRYFHHTSMRAHRNRAASSLLDGWYGKRSRHHASNSSPDSLREISMLQRPRRARPCAGGAGKPFDQLSAGRRRH